ncbi:hypothetical protein JCM33374_g329 [Metschnikowia sp. JCM 33374]|nr:hypothetical protein JCM33374_g329 [Metschnikowia sp. JCM 33374]
MCSPSKPYIFTSPLSKPLLTPNPPPHPCKSPIMNAQPQQRTMSYEHYFSQTLGRRMRYVNKICFLVAIFASVVLGVPYGGFWWNLFDSLYRVPLLFGAFWVVKMARSGNSTVEFSPAKSLAEHVAGMFFRGGFFASLASFCASSGVFFSVFLLQLPLLSQYYVLAKEFRVKPAVNDAWVYFWFHAFYVAVMYTLQHTTFQRNLLSIPIGTPRVNPEAELFSRPATLVGTAAFFTGFCSLSAPLVYILVRPLMYKFNWVVLTVFSLDTALPPLHIGWCTYVNVTFASFVLFLAWEVVNHVYNTYAIIGCLDGKSLICSRSPDPLATLLSGLRDVDPAHQLSRATAFQELAYVTSAPSDFCVKARNSIFNTQPRASLSVSDIINECSLVIRNTASRVNYRSNADMDALKNEDLFPKDPQTNIASTDVFIFGNSHDTTSNDTTQFAVSATSSPLKRSDAFDAVKPSRLGGVVTKFKLWEKLVATVWTPLKKYADSLYRPATLRQKQQIQKNTTAWKAQLAQFHQRFLASGVGFLFRNTPKRDAESRVLNWAVYGNAVIALSGLLTRAVEEDRSGAVTNLHISEVLNILEWPIRSCANYTDVLPASVYVTPAAKNTNNTVVTLMHDVTMHEFFQLCVKYNYKLNDLSLSSRTFKLAKRVIDVSIAQQQKRDKTQMSKYL